MDPILTAMAARIALPIVSNIGSNLASTFGISAEQAAQSGAAQGSSARAGKKLPQDGNSFIEGLRNAIAEIDDDAAEEFEEVLEDNGVAEDGASEALNALEQLVASDELSETEAFLALQSLA